MFVETTYSLLSLGYAVAVAGDLPDCFDLTQIPITFQTIAAPLASANFTNDKRPITAPDDD